MIWVLQFPDVNSLIPRESLPKGLYTFRLMITFLAKLYVQTQAHWDSLCTCIDEFQINEINVDLRTSGFDNEVLSVDACAVWWERESFYCLPRISVVTWHREPRFQCGSARTCSIWNSSILQHLRDSFTSLFAWVIITDSEWVVV